MVAADLGWAACIDTPTGPHVLVEWRTGRAHVYQRQRQAQAEVEARLAACGPGGPAPPFLVLPVAIRFDVVPEGA